MVRSSPHRGDATSGPRTLPHPGFAAGRLRPRRYEQWFAFDGREPLGEIRAALTAIGQDLRAGSRDLHGDVETLVRSAGRDTSKLGTALRGDVGPLLKAAPRLRTPTKRASHLPRRRTVEPHVKKTAA